MQYRAARSLSLLSVLVVAAALAAPQLADAQQNQNRDQEEGEPAPSIDANTGKVLNEAIEFLNMENYAAARTSIGTLDFTTLSPYERSKVEQILFSIASAQEDYDAARGHLREAINAGGLNAQEISQARYQMAQLFLVEEQWAEGAAALEEWFQTAENPNSAAYYLLAVAYYQQDDYERALPPAQRAVELTENPQESWVQLVLALYLQQDRYREAIPLLERIIAMVPDKKNYWMQLSSVYGQVEDYPRALAVMQLAYNAGLVTEDSEVRRLSDLLMFNEVPYRGAMVLEEAIENDMVALDAPLYEKLANCWIAAGEFDKSIPPLQRAAEMAGNGDLFVRLGEVHVQREDWTAATTALQSGINKGGLRDTGNAQLLMGIALFNQKNPQAARSWFERAAASERHRQMARGYIQMIDAQAQAG